MNFPKKAQVNVSAVKRNHFDLSSQYVGTLDFGTLVPTFLRKTIPNEKYTFNPLNFLRTSPMVVPTFGRVNINFNTFYVSMHDIWSQWNNLMTGEKYVNASGTSYNVSCIPFFTISDLQSLFLDNSSGFVTLLNVSLKPNYYSKNIFSKALSDHNILDIQDDTFEWDFCYEVTTDANNMADTAQFVLLTPRGKFVYKLLLSLGYQLPFVLDESSWQASSYIDYISDGTEVSLLPILAYVKCYIDWFQSNQFTLNSSIRQLFDKIRLQNYGSQVSSTDLLNLLQIFRRCYEPDLFTSSWLTPNADSNLTSLFIDVTPASSNGNINVTTNTGARSGSSNMNTSPQVSMLQRFQAFLDKWRIGGFRDTDRNLVEFGVKTPDSVNHRSMLINSYSQDLMISDVMSTSDTSGAALGDYAGKGMSYGSDKFSFECDDFGYIITICSIMPKTGYVYGLDRNHTDLTLLEQFTPDFDCVGVEAIANYQLCNPVNVLGGGISPSSVFGYCPRLSHVKTGLDKLVGDFRVPSLATGADAWHLFRRDYGETLSNNELFRQVSSSDDATVQSDNYDRIFQTGTDNSIDHFYIFCLNDVQCESPMRSIADNVTPVYDGEDHKTVSVDYNGKQL